MEFPRVGLIRNLTDSAILATWQYPPRDDGSNELTGDVPYVAYNPVEHEILDLCEYSPEQYVMIADQHHTSTVDVDMDGNLIFMRTDPEGGPDTPHEVGPPANAPIPTHPIVIGEEGDDV